MSLSSLLCIALLFAGPVLAAQQNAPTDASAQPTEQSVAKPDSAVSKLRVECVPASRASDLIGKHGCVAGRVFRVTTRKTGNTHLSLCPSHSKCSFQAVARARDRGQIGDLTYLHGKLIAVMGNVVDYRGHPRIILNDLEQIRVAASNPPPEFDAAQSKGSGNATSAGKHSLRAW